MLWLRVKRALVSVYQGVMVRCLPMNSTPWVGMGPPQPGEVVALRHAGCAP